MAEQLEFLTNCALLECDMCADSPLEYSILSVHPQEAGVRMNGQVVATNQCLLTDKHITVKFKQCKSPNYVKELKEITAYVRKQSQRLDLPQEDRVYFGNLIVVYNSLLTIAEANPTAPHRCCMLPVKWENIASDVANGLDFDIVQQIMELYQEFRAVCEEIWRIIYRAWNTIVLSNNCSGIDLPWGMNEMRYQRRIGSGKDRLLQIWRELLNQVDTYIESFSEAIQLKGDPELAVKVLEAQIAEMKQSMTGKKNEKRKRFYRSAFCPTRLIALYGREDYYKEKKKRAEEIYQQFLAENENEGDDAYFPLDEDLIDSPKFQAMPPLKRYMCLLQIGSVHFCGILSSDELSDGDYQKVQGSYFDDALKKLIQGLETKKAGLLEKRELTFLLHTKSFLPCKLGGIITVKDSGQWLIQAYQKTPANLLALSDEILSLLLRIPRDTSRDYREMDFACKAVLALQEMLTSDNGTFSKEHECPACLLVNMYPQNVLDKADAQIDIGLNLASFAVGAVGIVSSAPVWTVLSVGVGVICLMRSLAKNGVLDETGDAVIVGDWGKTFMNHAIQETDPEMLVSLGYPIITDASKGVIGNVSTAASGAGAFYSLMSAVDLMMQQYSNFYIGKIEVIIMTDSELYTFGQMYDSTGGKKGDMKFTHKTSAEFSLREEKYKGEDGIHLDEETQKHLESAESPWLR